MKNKLTIQRFNFGNKDKMKKLKNKNQNLQKNVQNLVYKNK